MESKVSVIIPMHNSAKYIEECMESVLNQTYKNIEVIVVDDKSSDNSVSIIEEINDNRIKIIKLQENVGAATARNTGVDASTGDFLCFLDSDDYWALDKLEKQVEFMQRNNYVFIYSDYAYLRDGKVQHIARVPKSMDYKSLLKNTAIFTSSVMFNMSYLQKQDIYMPNITRGQDMATWWQVLKKGYIAYAINEVLAYYRVGEKSLSSNKIKAIKRTWYLYTRENMSLFKRLINFTCYAYNAVKRRVV